MLLTIIGSIFAYRIPKIGVSFCA
ncbi:uncharacterized protein METZ01_LOCUS316418 [marine metagenome]|uniref:Uncharacterized protein n=1 Tax=marine metagenome TaxID=408172 RepID=A0A382NQV8_9ZZZZ